ncbi:hypothetical protein [Bacillus sp. AK031]
MKSTTKKQTLLNEELMEKRDRIKEDICMFYMERIPDTLEILYEEAHFEKKLQNLEPLFESPFHYKFIEHYGLNLFVDGFMFSLYKQANLLNDFMKENISLEVKERLDAMAQDARRDFNEQEVECFTLTAYKIFEFGIEAGKGYTL